MNSRRCNEKIFYQSHCYNSDPFFCGQTVYSAVSPPNDNEIETYEALQELSTKDQRIESLLGYAKKLYAKEALDRFFKKMGSEQ